MTPMEPANRSAHDHADRAGMSEREIDITMETQSKNADRAKRRGPKNTFEKLAILPGIEYEM